MTPITAREVEDSTFDTRFRGYDTGQVDDVLARVAYTLHAYEEGIISRRMEASNVWREAYAAGFEDGGNDMWGREHGRPDYAKPCYDNPYEEKS